jgi:hypothetical protein
MAAELEINFEQVIAALPQLDAGELADMMDRASSLLKKAIGGSVAKKKVAAIPSQLERNHEWTKFVLADATMNGWEPFVMRTSKLNKETQEKEVTEVMLRESVETEGGHVFADTGKSMSQGQAMCYGKLLRDREDVVWKDFDSQYEQVAPKASAAKVVKKTSQQVQEEKAAKAAEKEAEKARKAAEKEEEKRKKEEEKKKKEEEKAAKKPASKTIVPRPRPRSPAPAAAAAAVVVEEVEEMPELEALPAPAPVAVAPKGIVMKKKIVKEVRPAVDPFKLPEDCTHNVWLWKETQYLRDADNYLWLFDATTQEQGDFKGRYNYAKDEIEECEEPQMVEDEEELDA